MVQKEHKLENIFKSKRRRLDGSIINLDSDVKRDA